MYSKQTWKTGDVITQEKLNHMEDGISTGGGIYTYSEVSLFDGSVITAKQSEGVSFTSATITLQGDLPKSDISVTFNGQDYTLPYGYSERLGDYWGEVVNNTPSFTSYPLLIGLSDHYLVVTPEAGTYSLKISNSSLVVNDNFKSNFIFVVNAEERDSIIYLDKTWQEINDAMLSSLLAVVIISSSTGSLAELVTSTNQNSGYNVYTIANSFGNTMIRTYSANGPKAYPSSSNIS